MIVTNAANEKQLKALMDFGDFINADSIEYIDNGKSEKYIIRKEDKNFVISVSGNQYDGGFANFHKIGE